MNLYSTKNPALRATLREAVLKGLPPDNGLYMPERIPVLADDFFESLSEQPFAHHCVAVAQALLGASIPADDLETMVERAIDFPAPLVPLSDQQYILELYHGPSLAFKDFGARFMAELMSYFNRGANRDLIILVATSGDTGGAVAAGFLGKPGIQVVILYPKDKVSFLQEKQLTTLGKNIRALEIDGAFDDCQALVKQAFLDEALTGTLRLTSANSINIARLIPQSFYYFEAYRQLPEPKKAPAFIVPSGNFGNLTAGLLAHRMGLPSKHFVAATNRNSVVPTYLKSGNFTPRPSVRTLSNAMDVGNPSNFTRMLDLFKEMEEGSTWNQMREKVLGYAFDDEATLAAVSRVYQDHGYFLDPHTAVGYLAAQNYRKAHPGVPVIVLATAHPAKFSREIQSALPDPIPLPERLGRLARLEGVRTPMPNHYPTFRSYLLDQLR